VKGQTPNPENKKTEITN